MYSYLLTIAYNGKKYSGWQRLGHTGNTVQGKLEKVLSMLIGYDKMEVDGAGRTDAGVHARGQKASFRTATELSGQKIQSFCNQYLPKDIRVTHVERVPDSFHARLNAKGKEYEYRIDNGAVQNVFFNDFAWYIPAPLDLEAMAAAAKQLEGTHDFSSFTAYRGKKSKVRTIESIRISKENGLVSLQFTGNGFLYKMVRILTGTLVEIGLGKPMDIETLLHTKNRPDAGLTAPPHGLFLNDVFY